MKSKNNHDEIIEVISPIRGKNTNQNCVNASFISSKIIRKQIEFAPFTSVDDYWKQRKLHRKKEVYKGNVYQCPNEHVKLIKRNTAEWFVDDYSFLGKK